MLEAYRKTECHEFLVPFETLIEKFTQEQEYLLVLISDYQEKIKRPISSGELGEQNPPMRIKKK